MLYSENSSLSSLPDSTLESSECDSVFESQFTSQADLSNDTKSRENAAPSSRHKRKRVKKGRKVVNDPIAVRCVVSQLLMSHFSSDRTQSYCNCLDEFRTSAEAADKAICLFQSCREYMAIFNDSGPSSHRNQIKEFLQGIGPFYLNSYHVL